MQGNTLSSEWGGAKGLSEYLIASFYEVKKVSDGKTWRHTADCDPQTVKAALTDASMEIALNWQSPFEQAGAESKAPALMAMLQSGALQPLISAIVGKDNATGAQQKANDFLSQFEGRTGITKLNSTQVFTGMPPVKIQVTALFRAWKDPLAEVETPFDKLMAWSLPVSLSDDGSMLANAARTVRGEMGAIDAVMPSATPIKIAMQYKGRTFSPLVIESIGMPLNSPVDKNGRFVELAVPLTLCTLTAIDRQDWSDSKTIKI